jgi:hypothetical protein
MTIQQFYNEVQMNTQIEGFTVEGLKDGFFLRSSCYMRDGKVSRIFGRKTQASMIGFNFSTPVAE